ncbi:(Fe-S)-binding protein [Paenibacillus sp. y28]|uniref:(Fe-S)-binding protein n=1 Tax=Paenibacillus sp. y28 TaxID=3129110 RepID=UPI00301ACA60
MYHHTQLIARWLREGRLHPKQERKETVVYHDSCYLGRYNGEYAGPRQIVSALPGLTLVEAAQSRSESMCCGAGGGRMWMEEQEGTRINEARTGQLLAAQPAVIATVCPYCMTMIADVLKQCEADARVQALDIAELVARSL